MYLPDPASPTAALFILRFLYANNFSEVFQRVYQVASVLVDRVEKDRNTCSGAPQVSQPEFLVFYSNGWVESQFSRDFFVRRSNFITAESEVRDTYKIVLVTLAHKCFSKVVEGDATWQTNSEDTRSHGAYLIHHSNLNSQKHKGTRKKREANNQRKVKTLKTQEKVKHSKGNKNF